MRIENRRWSWRSVVGRSRRGRSPAVGRRCPFTPRAEALEDRLLLSVSAEGQYMVYLLNRARNDPATYENEAGLPEGLLDGVEARPPLAVNDGLFGSAEFHADEMATYNYFGHQSQVTGDWPNKMARDFGYDLPGTWADNANYIESIAAGHVFTTADATLAALIWDDGINPPGHRIHLLGTDSFHAGNREVGAGYAEDISATYRHYWAIHATRSDTADAFLTGIVFDDANGNSRYDMNEGIAGTTITADGLQTTSNAMGGWSIQVTAGTYTVSASGGGFVGTSLTTLTVGSDSVEVDFVSGVTAPMVDFEFVAAPDPPEGTTIGVHRGDRFFQDANGNGAWDGSAGGDSMVSFGADGDTPIVGDWNGDGTDDIGVQRGDRFYLDANGNGRWDGDTGGDILYRFGAIGDTAVTGDWNGNGTATIGVQRGDRFYLDANGNGRWDGTVGGDIFASFGAVGDRPIVGDWNGDGTDAIGVHRGNVFFLDVNGNGIWDGTAGGDATFGFGATTDIPVIGDWNGDGTDQVGLHRGDRFYLDVNGNRTWDGVAGGDALYSFGIVGDTAIAGRWAQPGPGALLAATDPTGTGSEILAAPAAEAVLGAALNDLTIDSRHETHGRLWRAPAGSVEASIMEIARARHAQTPLSTAARPTSADAAHRRRSQLEIEWYRNELATDLSPSLDVGRHLTPSRSLSRSG